MAISNIMRILALAVAVTPLVGYALWQNTLEGHASKLKEAGGLSLTLTISQIGGTTNDVRVVLSKPNMIRVEEPNRVVTTDGKTVWTYDKASKSYDEAPADSAAAQKWLNERAWVYTAFFNADFAADVASAVKGSSRKLRNVNVTDWTVTRKDKQVFQIQMDDALGVARGFRTTQDKYEWFVFAKELEISANPLSSDQFVFKAPEGVTKKAAPEPGSITFADIKPILDQNCVGCHSGGGAKKGVDLSSYANVSKYVTPGDPANSRMISPVKRGIMPPGRPLPTETVAKLEAWVRAGAKP